MTNRIIHFTAFLILALLWLGFGAAVLFRPDTLRQVWTAFLGWPLVGQLTIGLLALPVVLGLWAWESSWPLWLRLTLVIGLAWVTLYTFFPKPAQPNQKMTATKL